jgi:NAD(P)H-dependent flavin oxidoreductase YrpB (nitropropane dioxygenase family)
MAGGPSSVALGAAVSSAGGFAFLAGGYKRPDALATEIAAARQWGAPFGVNLFAPGCFEPDLQAFAAYAQRRTPEAEVYRLELDPMLHTDDDHWHDKLALLLDNPVPVVSFTFALPPAGDIARLRKVGSIVLASVTRVDEALAAEAAGVDGLVVQGSSAGGPSATWDPQRPIVNRPTEQLITDAHTSTRLPLIAAGAIDGPHSDAALIAAGAEAVAVGTLFLRAEEAGTVQTHRDALAARGGAGTVMTCAFTGRPARALRNAFCAIHDVLPAHNDLLCVGVSLADLASRAGPVTSGESEGPLVIVGSAGCGFKWLDTAMAATYPAQFVVAARWARRSPATAAIAGFGFRHPNCVVSWTCCGVRTSTHLGPQHARGSGSSC